MKILYTLFPVIMLMMVGCSRQEKPAPTKSPDKKAFVETVEPPKAKADFSLTAEDFFKEYQKDKQAADAKFVNKMVELTGVPEFVGTSIANEPYIRLPGEKFDTISCFTVDQEPWTKVLPGQKVKIKGKCPEFVLAPRLVQCTIVEADPYPAISMTAGLLAKDFEADGKMAADKYGDTYVVVTGEVVDHKGEDKTGARIYLKGSGKMRVECNFRFFLSDQQKDFLAAIKAGQPFKAVGKCSPLISMDTVEIGPCNPIKLP